MFAANSATASLNATTTCGRSSDPVCRVEVNAPSGKSAERSPAVWSSVLRIVPVATASAMSTPASSEPHSPFPGGSSSPVYRGVALDSRTVSVSGVSSTVSSMTGTDTVFAVSPGAKVSAPLVSV